MREIEIKLRVQDRAALRRRLRRLGFESLGPRQIERNLVFDTPRQTLRASRQLLRLRSKGSRWWLTWKGQPEAGTRHKVRPEIELEVSQGQRLGEILTRLGYQPAFEYHKFRTEFHQPRRRGKAMLDETPVGDFLELEGPPAWIDRLAAGLGYGPQDYILASYASLYLAWCREQGLPPENMVFSRKKLLHPFRP